MSEERKRELCTRMASMLPSLRKTVGATQQQLASSAGIGRNTVVYIERKKTMSWSTYLSLLMVFLLQENAVRLIRAYDLYPNELEQCFAGGAGAEA